MQSNSQLKIINNELISYQTKAASLKEVTDGTEKA